MSDDVLPPAFVEDIRAGAVKGFIEFCSSQHNFYVANCATMLAIGAELQTEQKYKCISIKVGQSARRGT